MLCDICGAEAWYVCGNSGRPVCPQHSRIEIVSRLSFGSSGGLTVREVESPDYGKITELAKYFRSGTKVEQLDKEYDITELPGFIVSSSTQITGVLSYAVEPECLVIVILDVLPGYQGLGAGKMLLEAAKAKAAAEGKPCIQATASNDDLPSIYFYQRNGFRIYDVKTDLIAEKHNELRVGFSGIPSLDEIRLRYNDCK